MAIFPNLQLPSPEQPYPLPHLANLWVKRDDLIHLVISGNKWRKLAPHLLAIKQAKRVVSFGGAHSNHLHALGHLCHTYQQPFLAIISGHYADNPTPTMRDLQHWGTEFIYLDKVAFRQLQNAPNYAQQAWYQQGDYVIAEGGADPQGLTGVGVIVDELQQHYDLIVLPVATGMTMAGIIAAAPKQTQVLGIAVLNAADYLQANVEALLAASGKPLDLAKWQINHQFHGGGYAKVNESLRQFCQQQTLPLEPIYSGKALWGLSQLALRNPAFYEQKILFLHTGGLQGLRAQKS